MTKGLKSNIFQNNLFRFGVTLVLCVAYSLLRTTEFSTWTKPLPIIFWLLIVLLSPKLKSARWVICSLSFAFIGDIMLDLGDQWLKVGALPFLGSTGLLAWAFHKRLNDSQSIVGSWKRILLLALVCIPFVFLYFYLRTFSSEAATTGGVLFTLSALLISTSLSNALFNHTESHILTWCGVLGVLGIVANYVLYSFDLYVTPMPRDLVIQVYYWGTAMAAWSFLKRPKLLA